jgi:hypothetical protein
MEPMCLRVSAVAAAVRPPELCTGALHVGSDGLGVGRVVGSTELARLACAARGVLGVP